VQPPLLANWTIPLTPGPLVVAVKDRWPPNYGAAVETIAASYVPPEQRSGVRLFNLSPDSVAAGMKIANVTAVRNIKYSTGSPWVPVDVESTEFEAFVDSTEADLCSVTVTPPEPPLVFTNFLLGLARGVNGSSPFSARLLPAIDAPEYFLP